MWSKLMDLGARSLLMRVERVVFASVICWIAWSNLSPPVLARPKTDVIVMENGDRVTGEIKSLGGGLLELKTDFMGTLSIEWEHIQRIDSDYTFQVELANGERYVGAIETKEVTAEGRDLEITGIYSTFTTKQREVVKMTQIEDRFWQRLNVWVDFGFGFTRANRAKETNVGFRTEYRVTKYLLTTQYNALHKSQRNTNSTSRNDLTINFQRFFADRWFASSVNSFNQSEELGLDIRALLGGAVGRNLIQSTTSSLALLGGAGYNRERFTGEAGVSSWEGLGGLQFQTVKFRNPKMEIITDLFVIPSLTNWGRYRINLNTSIRFEVFKDLNWGAGLFDNFDSRPAEGNERNDFGVSTTLGYKF